MNGNCWLVCSCSSILALRKFQSTSPATLFHFPLMYSVTSISESSNRIFTQPCGLGDETPRTCDNRGDPECDQQTCRKSDVKFPPKWVSSVPWKYGYNIHAERTFETFLCFIVLASHAMNFTWILPRTNGATSLIFFSSFKISDNFAPKLTLFCASCAKCGRTFERPVLSSRQWKKNTNSKMERAVWGTEPNHFHVEMTVYHR